jgi:enoyl-CoA hydratase/carnithine racemase
MAFDTGDHPVCQSIFSTRSFPAMEDRISITVESGVADVRLIRSDKMNALDSKMFAAIVAAGEQLRADPTVRVVVLSGEGRAFCAGLDMSSFAGMAQAESDAGGADSGKSKSQLADRSHGIANLPQHAAWMWRELPVPVIAAVHGVALGGGFQVMLGADMRYAAPGTRLSIMEIKWGLVPDMAGTQLLRQLVRELTYTGRIFNAEEALEMGFVTAVVDDPRAHALELARQIASKNPEAIRASKRLLNEANYLSAADGLLQESREQDAIIGQPNQIESVMAEMERRVANFTD